MEPEPTVFIVDDDPALRESLAKVVGTIGLKVQSHASAQEFLDAYRPVQPGCLVLDVRLPGIGGLELQQYLMATGHDLPTIIMTAYGDVRTAVAAMKAGAVEFLEKPFRSQQLCEVIQQAVQQGKQSWLLRRRRLEAERRLASLTRGQKEVLERVSGGKTNRVIAEELQISIRTVEDRRARAMRKLGVRSRAELLAVVAAAGITSKNPAG